MKVASPSGTGRRIFGALLFVPLIALFCVSQSMAQWLLVPLAIVMGWEFVSMLAMPRPLRIALMFDLFLFSLPAPVVASMETGAQMPLFPVFLALGGLLVAFIWLSSRNRLATSFIAILVLCILGARTLLGLPNGHITLLCLAAVVAACDIAAYFVGRRVGGPKLAQLISPNKTRSGAVGGIGGAILASLAVMSWVPFSMVEILVGGAVIAVLAQAGDLLESALKRNLGVKDSGNLIPGHGGFLDRFDGYLLTLPVMCLYIM
ncbi:MAG: phosphatidate cytidylyltransferase [Candidatus Puniceispirillaceae bacterium]|jgi:phosphatidate cytidylyltransferase